MIKYVPSWTYNKQRKTIIWEFGPFWCVCEIRGGVGGGEADINPVYMPTENMYQVEHIRNKGKILKQLFESVNPAVHVHASWMFVIHPLLLLWRGPKNSKERYECDRNRVF